MADTPTLDDLYDMIAKHGDHAMIFVPRPLLKEAAAKEGVEITTELHNGLPGDGAMIRGVRVWSAARQSPAHLPEEPREE